MPCVSTLAAAVGEAQRSSAAKQNCFKLLEAASEKWFAVARQRLATEADEAVFLSASEELIDMLASLASQESNVEAPPAWITQRLAAMRHMLGEKGHERQETAAADAAHGTLDVPGVQIASMKPCSIVTKQRAFMDAFAKSYQASTTDTFRVPPTAHDVMDVPNTVAAAISGALGKRDTHSGEGPLHSSTLGPLVAGDTSFVKHYRDTFSLDVRAVALADTQPSMFRTTTRLQPNTTSHADLRDGINRVANHVANSLHIAIERYPSNVQAFYAMMPLLNDASILLGAFDPLYEERHMTNGSDDNMGGDLAPSVVPLPHCDGTSASLGGGEPVETITMIGILLGNGITKVVAEAERIIVEATGSYCDGDGAVADGLHNAGEVPDVKHCSAALLTILCSVLQPIIAVGSALPTSDVFRSVVHRSVEMTTVSLRDAAVRCCQSGGKLRRAAKQQFPRDALILHRYLAAHPWLEECLVDKTISFGTSLVLLNSAVSCVNAW